MDNKPIVAMDISSSGKGGGPYVSTKRIMDSNLKYKYDFMVIHYRTELGRGISIKRIKDLSNQIKNINPDIVHFSGLTLSGFHMAIACRLAGIKNSLVTIHGTSADAIYFSRFKKILMVYVIEFLTLLLTKYNCGVSNFVSDRLIEIFKRKSVGTIYNIPPAYSINTIDFRKELKINPMDTVIVTVGRINQEKGYHILDEAILKFKESKGVIFIIIGNGDYLPRMQEKLGSMVEDKKVIFMGHRDDIQTILKCCDVFVLPTLHETLSIALLEASVEGLPLIASNTGGVPEIIENGYNGLLVEPGNINELHNAIEYLLTHKEKRKEFGYNSKKKVESKFSPATIEKKIDSVYQILLNNE